MKNMNARYQSFMLILASVLLILIIYLNFPMAITRNQTSATPRPRSTSFLSEIVSDVFKPKAETNQWTLITVGDIMLGRSVMVTSLGKNDTSYPFRKVADKLRGADLTFANLENPIVSNCPKVNTGFKFCALPSMLSGLNLAGIDAVSLDNNHTGNFGVSGLEETKQHLTDAKIGYTSDNLLIAQVKNYTVGFLGLDLVDHPLTDKDLELIKGSKLQVDILIVAPHWGVEYTNHPTINQKTWAKEIIDSGADIIVGSHPHWVQDTDHVEGKPIYYSLGNFVFDQRWCEETKNGMAVKFTFSGKQLVKEEKMPIYMKDLAQPEWLNN